MERDQAIKFVHELLRVMVSKKASDLFITAGFPPGVQGRRQDDAGIQPEPDAHAHHGDRAGDHERQAGAGVRGHQGVQLRHQPARHRPLPRQRLRAAGAGRLVLRTITTTIPRVEDLGLPDVLKDVVMTKRGLVIVVGATGSGKSTSLAAMIGYRNENSYGHIITIEDPIEYVHDHKNCLITQREVGVDTESWHAALKNTLRQAPDVILIGEIRDRETMDHAIAFAETGHLCLATLHANSSNQALDRIINFFPEERRAQLLMDLSLNLKGMISQRLIPRRDGPGRVAAIEIMLNTPLISDLIFKGEVHEIKEIMKKSRELGMQTFDQALFDLYEARLISYEDAMRNADSMNELRLAIKLHGQEAKDKDIMDGIDHLNIV